MTDSPVLSVSHTQHSVLRPSLQQGKQVLCERTDWGGHEMQASDPGPEHSEQVEWHASHH